MRPRHGDLKYPELSYALVGCAMDVHRELGPGQDEWFYHLALAEALKQKGFGFRYKPKGKLIHKGVAADEFEADLILEDCIIAELKALAAGFRDEHLTQIICYLKFWAKDLGILMDFGKESLARKRVPYTVPTAEVDISDLDGYAKSLKPTDRELSQWLGQVVLDLQSQYGLGYRDTTYSGLLRAELSAQGVSFAEDPAKSLAFQNRSLGKGTMKCFLVDGRCVVRVFALYDDVHAAHRAIVQAYVRHLGVPFGLVVNFGKKALQIRTVIAGRE